MKLYPYLSFNGNCEEALDFYKQALEGHIAQIGRYGDSPMKASEEFRDKILHARLVFGDAMIMASDAMNESELKLSDNVSLSIQCDNNEQLEKIFSNMSAGGKVTMPLQDQFWGARFGMLTDKFGFHWMFNCEKKN